MTKQKHTTARGGCLCGAVRYRITAALRDVVNCHCGQCRRTHGHFSAYTAVDPQALEFTRSDGLKWFRSSETAQRGFCAECGASLFWRPADRSYLSVAAGTLDLPTNLHTGAHIYCVDASDYYEIDDGLPRYPGDFAASAGPGAG